MKTRDDIKDTIIELLHKEFEWIDGQIDSEEVALADFDIDNIDKIMFVLSLEDYFNIEITDEVIVRDWKIVKDIVNYIEVALQNKIGEE